MNGFALVKLLEVAFVGLGSSTVVLFFAWLKTRERAIRAETALQYVQPTTTRNNDRIEAAVDAVALEVERLAEGQRFVARLLSERSFMDAPRSVAPKSITPH